MRETAVSLWNSYGGVFTSRPRQDASQSRYSGAMKTLLQTREKRAEFSALATVIAVLAIGTAAKLGLAVQILHFVY